jgi:DNA-binding NarL/FixJ family response regulator
LRDACRAALVDGAVVEQLRVLVVDDHQLFAEALAARLAAEPDLVLLPVAGNGGQCLAAAAAGRPHVVVLDLMLADESGLDVLDRLRAEDPGVKVIILTGVRDVNAVVDAVRRRADAWLPKTTSVEELARVIRGVVRGEGWIPPDLLGEVLRRLAEPPDPGADTFAVLTERERQVLQCLVDGLSRAEIARRLYVSTNTVRTHTQNVLSKIGRHSVLEAVSFALRSGLRPTGS